MRSVTTQKGLGKEKNSYSSTVQRLIKVGSYNTFLSGLADAALHQTCNLRPHNICEGF